ncbi:MAG TPA: DUF5671 domain-containing protein [Patescibacteria group bacterium]|nr:DUF5671 domain-containing protein [Patescibacteria group bacterium]
MEQTLMPSAPSGADKIVQGPKALFWYLTLFFTLGITAFNVGGLWFQFINKWVSQEVVYGMVQRSFSQTALKFALASLLVATPLFFIFSTLIRKALKQNTLDPKNKIRVWVTYIILFLTIAIAVGDLITTVFRVLDGDFTLRFILKSLSILIIVCWIFAYYWQEMRSENSLAGSNLPRLMGGVTAGVVIISFIGTFFVIESPALARAKAYDRTRISHLQEIRASTEDYYRIYGKLPENLEVISSKYGYLQIKDPKTEKPYEYSVTGSDTYQLCAEFETSNKDENKDRFDAYYSEFLYDLGRNCFDQKIAEYLKENPAKPLPVR